MATALHQSTHRRLASILGFGLLMAVVFFVPSLSGAQNTCPQNTAVGPLLTQCVTAPPTDVTDCPLLCPGPNCVDTWQEAVDAAAANAPAAQVIGIFINTTGNAVISAAQDLRIEQCRNAKITADDPLLPVLHIQSTAGDGDPTNNVHPTTKDIFIHGPDFIDGSVGVQVDNNSTEGKGLRALNNGIGILVTGSNNTINGSNGDKSSDAGIVVAGNNNTIRNSKALNNFLIGFAINGAENSVRANTAQGNGTDGFSVQGNNNTLQDNRANKNANDGFEISGDNNILTKNLAERNNQDGFDVSGTGNRLRDNKANANTGDEFDVVAGNIDLGGNKANGATCPLPGVCP